MVHIKRAVAAAIGAVSVVALIAGCSSGSSSATSTQTAAGTTGVDWSSVEPVELTVSSIFPAGSTSSKLVDEWMKAVTAKTEGKVTFDFYGDGTLHGSPESLSALQSGLTDVTYLSDGTFPDQLPISNWDDKTVQQTLSGYGYPNMNVAGLAQQVIHYTEGNGALAEMEAAGFKPLLAMLSGPASLICSEPFKNPADLAGRQVRVPYASAKGEFEALGMVGVFTPPNEQYEALQRGVLNCAVNAPTTVLSAGLLDVAPYVTYVDNAPSAGSNWVIATATWDALPPEIQQVLMDARYEPLTNFAKNTLEAHKELVNATEKAGGSYMDATELNPPIAGYWASQPDPVSVAPAGVDAAAAVAHTQRVADAWLKFSTEELKVPAGDEDILAVLEKGSDIIEWEPWTQALRDQLGAQ